MSRAIAMKKVHEDDLPAANPEAVLMFVTDDGKWLAFKDEHGAICGQVRILSAGRMGWVILHATLDALLGIFVVYFLGKTWGWW